jgi:hypothetical protein
VRRGVGQDTGASLRETGSRASTEPQEGLRPVGFDPARIERPSTHGAILGEALSDLAKAGSVGDQLLDLMCATCAFREGCMTNQMAATGMTALNCVLGIDPEEFACHHGMKNGEPTKLCAGYLAARRAPKPIVQAALQTVMARLRTKPDEDEIRTAFDEWVSVADPENTLDNYARARLYTRAIADRTASGMPLRENNVDCSRPQAGSPTAESGDAQPQPQSIRRAG